MRRAAADPASLTERHVQAIWYDASLRPSGLRTVRGERVQVVDPGVWNLEAGPDFRGAVIEVDGRRIDGDVEVHMRPSDWTAHRHDCDPCYGNVVAHVTWRGGEPPGGLPEGCASICIGERLMARRDFSPAEIDVTAYPYAKLPRTSRPCERFFGGNPDVGLAWLGEAGRRRLEAKAHRFEMRLARTGNPEQVFYEEMFAAFGYAKNSATFRALAERMPFAELPSTEEMALETLKSVAELEVVWRHPWRLANVRPGNAPSVRLADAAALFTGGKPRHIGGQLSAAILANVIVPFALARGALREPPEWLPPEGQNAVTRLTAFRLFGRDHNPALYSGNGVLLQGLIQIHHEFCLSAHPDCDGCGLVQAIEREFQTRR